MRAKRGNRTRIGFMLKQATLPTGYKQVCLFYNNKIYPRLVHRLAGKAFLDNPDSLKCINHIDGDKSNNSVENLEWCSYKQNMEHAIKTKLLEPRVAKPSMWKLSENDIERIQALYKEGVSQSAIAKQYSIHQCHVSRIVSKKRRILCL